MEHFKEHDLDGSGKITYDEFMKERKKELGDLFDQTEQTAIFDEADKDKTNTITIAEACPSNSLRPGGTSPPPTPPTDDADDEPDEADDEKDVRMGHRGKGAFKADCDQLPGRTGGRGAKNYCYQQEDPESCDSHYFENTEKGIRICKWMPEVTQKRGPKKTACCSSTFLNCETDPSPPTKPAKPAKPTKPTKPTKPPAAVPAAGAIHWVKGKAEQDCNSVCESAGSSCLGDAGEGGKWPGPRTADEACRVAAAAGGRSCTANATADRCDMSEAPLYSDDDRVVFCSSDSPAWLEGKECTRKFRARKRICPCAAAPQSPRPRPEPQTKQPPENEDVSFTEARLSLNGAESQELKRAVPSAATAETETAAAAASEAVAAAGERAARAQALARVARAAAKFAKARASMKIAAAAPSSSAAAA